MSTLHANIFHGKNVWTENANAKVKVLSLFFYHCRQRNVHRKFYETNEKYFLRSNYDYFADRLSVLMKMDI